MEEAKFIVTPESKQLEFEAALLAHEDEICAAYERKQQAAAAKESGEDGKDDDAANGKAGDKSDDEKRGRSRSAGRRGRSHSRSRSRSDSRSRSRGRGGSSRNKREKKKVVVEVPPKRGFQEILDKRAVNLGIVFDALVEKAQVKRKEEVRALCQLLHQKRLLLLLFAWRLWRVFAF